MLTIVLNSDNATHVTPRLDYVCTITEALHGLTSKLCISSYNGACVHGFRLYFIRRFIISESLTSIPVTGEKPPDKSPPVKG